MNPPEHRARHAAEDPHLGERTGAYAPSHSRGGVAEPTTLLPVIEATEPPSPPVEEPEGSGAAHNSAIMAIGSLVSRGTGFVRTAVMAMALGGALTGNAYTTAQVFPGMVYELLIGGIMSSVLVPMLVRARKQDADKGAAYTQRLLTLSFIVLGITTILATICAPLLAFVYASEASDASRHVITMLSYLMLPTIFFYGLSGLCGAILNARHSFAAPMFTPILNNLVVIATGIFYMVTFGTGQIEPEDMTPGRILVLGGGFLLGILTQALGLLPALRKTGFRFKWRTDFRALDLRQLGKVGGWMFCYVIVNQLALMVLFNLLNRGGKTDPGPMIYNNVFLLLMMAHGIVAVSVITALLPRMAAAAVDGRAGDIANDLSQGIRMVTVLLAPIAVVYAVLALPIAVALFQGGAFTSANSEATQGVLMVAGLTLVPMSISQLYNFTYYSLQDTKTPALINLPVVALRLSVQLAWFAAFAISATAMGMMVGNGVSFVAATLLSGLLLRRRIGRIGLKAIIATGSKVLIASLVAAAAGFGVLKLLSPDGTLGKGMAFVILIAGGAVIGGVYLIVARLLGTRELAEVFALVRQKIGR